MRACSEALEGGALGGSEDGEGWGVVSAILQVQVWIFDILERFEMFSGFSIRTFQAGVREITSVRQVCADGLRKDKVCGYDQG